MNTVTLLILDGWGYAPSWGGNAISQAETPNFDKLWRTYPHATLGASGTDVGLPGHEAGNSEVGHLNIGAGRIVHQDISRISKSISDGSFFENTVLLEAVNHVKKNQSKLHIMGLVSDGGVHSHLDHLLALLEFVKRQNIKEVFIHVFTDGRDTDPQSALTYVSKLISVMNESKIGKIATICGRYYAMDRDHHWERTQLAYQTIAQGIGQTAHRPLTVISSSYIQGITDEFIRPTVILENNQPVAKVSDNDSVIFFNFRADRARQLTNAFIDEKFNYFKRKKINNLFFTGFIPYEAETDGKVKSAFGQQSIKNTLSEVISQHQLKQFHIAETEKYAHVTYFFNGGEEKQIAHEDRLMIPSLRISTYDLKPEMSCKKITDNLVEKIKEKKYSLIVANFANADMVGHSGNFRATISACEVVDDCIDRVYQAIEATHGILIITADHGNADEILNARTGNVNTEHSRNPVPFILIDKMENNHQYKLKQSGILADIAPTILEILHIPKAIEMTGNSLIE